MTILRDGEEIMKKIVVSIVLVLIAAAGCTQQKQEQKGQGVVPQGAAPMVSPAEMKLLEETAKANPKNANAWTALGNALMDSRRFSEAIDAYQKSLDIDPNNVDVRVDMGTCYRNSGKPDRALEEYRRALKINPNHPFAHRNSGVVLAFDLHDKAQAIKEFEKYLELAPNAPDASQIRNTIEQLKAGK
jgi:tetratricopeptide (TPR) repeat protein